MTTVPKPDTPAPADNSNTTLLSSDLNLYVRPTAGLNAGPAPASIPQIDQINRPGNAPTNAGPDMGHGATQIVAQPDGTGHPAGDAIGGGTVGNSGDQGALPATTDLDFASDAAHPETG